MKGPTTPHEIKKCLENPLYYYNKYLRLPGHKKLTKKEFAKKVADFKKEKESVGVEKVEELENKKAEMFFENKPDLFETMHEAVKKDAEAKGIKLPSQQE